jgi:hypothetical protein
VRSQAAARTSGAIVIGAENNMTTAALSRASIESSYALEDVEREVRVNALSVNQLFALYERTGFLYPAKAARLMPYLPAVRDNWRRLLQAGDSLLYVLSAGDERQGCASIAVWRTTRESWVWQHLVCESHPLRSRGVMLGGLTRCMRLGLGESQQNWFRPENRFPARVFGSMVATLGDTVSSVRRYMYFAVPRQLRVSPVPSVEIVPYDASQHATLCGLAAQARGELYVAAEDLIGDAELHGVDALYQAVGLRRTRHVWLAYARGSGQVIGAALAYRGPLGLNFSFIENRCDLLVSPALSATDASHVTTSLIHAAVAAYADSAHDEIPVAVDAASASALLDCGGQLLRTYCQGIWLKESQPALYRHVDSFYTRLLTRESRHRGASTLTA